MKTSDKWSACYVGPRNLESWTSTKICKCIWVGHSLCKIQGCFLFLAGHSWCKTSIVTFGSFCLRLSSKLVSITMTSTRVTDYVIILYCELVSSVGTDHRTDWLALTGKPTNWKIDRVTDWWPAGWIVRWMTAGSLAYWLRNSRLQIRPTWNKGPSHKTARLIHFFLPFSGTANSPSSRARALCFSDEQCQNGGSCLNQSCFCTNGYYGPKCENKRQCDKNFPCQNNGTCELDRWTNTSFCNCNQYSVCDGRFEGVFCEKKAPCHANGYCLNGGVCRRDPYLNGVFFCKCRHGFSGPDCREITSCRNSKVCLNGARCISNKCSCDGDRHTGHFCELEVTSG